MAPSTRSVPDGFEALTDTISIYRPHVSHDGHSPSLVLICSWMAALPRHITKYTDQYKQLFPSSTILVMQSCWRDVAASDEKMVDGASSSLTHTYTANHITNRSTASPSPRKQSKPTVHSKEETATEVAKSFSTSSPMAAPQLPTICPCNSTLIASSSTRKEVDNSSPASS